MDIDQIEAVYDRLFEALNIAIEEDEDFLAFLIGMAVYEVIERAGEANAA